MRDLRFTPSFAATRPIILSLGKSDVSFPLEKFDVIIFLNSAVQQFLSSLLGASYLVP